MPANNQATDDQLAALYLRSRDTPCPNCNYNRRDSTSSTCPECNHSFTLVSIGSLELTRYIRLAKTILLITGFYALTVLIQNMMQINLIIRIANGSASTTGQTSYITVWSIRSLTYIVALVLAFLFWNKARRNEELSITKVVLPLAIIVVHMLLYSAHIMILRFF